MRQPSVATVLAGVEVESVRAVRVARRLEARRRSEDARDLVRDPRHRVRRSPAEHRHIADVDLRLALGEIAPVDVITASALEERIVDVGDVLDVLHARAVCLEKPDEHVEHGEGERMTHMAGVVWGDTADVERQRLAPARRDRNVALGQRVAKAQTGQGLSSGAQLPSHRHATRRPCRSSPTAPPGRRARSGRRRRLAGRSAVGDPCSR